MTFTIRVNRKTHSVDATMMTPMLRVMRDVLGMTGTKFGCALGLCGACTKQSVCADHRHEAY
jgi:isoquinoline 1-oxidoreductase alpha subunit